MTHAFEPILERGFVQKRLNDDDDVMMKLLREKNLSCYADGNLLLELLPPLTADADAEPADPQIALVPKLKKKKKKKRERALEESATPPKAKKMKVRGDEE